MIRSLRSRLTVAVLAVVTGVLVVFSLALHAVIARALWSQLDEGLARDAAAVAGMVEDSDKDGWEFEYGSLPDFERPTSPAYFQVWLADGRALARSVSLAGRDLAPLPGPGAWPRLHDVTLPDGRPGRAIEIRHAGRAEDAPVAPVRQGAPARPLVTVAVARGTEDVRATLARIRWWLLGLGALVLVGASAAAVAAVARGLRPAQALAAEIGRIDERRLGDPLAVEHLPRELAPIAGKLNDLLARLRASFDRERMFTADVSHELRTPLAALGTTLEVARLRERTPDDYRHTIDDAQLVVAQMQHMVEDLLMLARLDTGQLEVRNEQIHLKELVSDCWRPLQAHADGRRLAFSNDVPDAARIVGDRDKLRVVLTNLLTNAAEYTEEGGWVRVHGGTGATLVEVRDSGPRISDELLPRIFDRFSRADASRSGGLHCGIGLAVVKGMCDVLGLATTADNAPDGSVRFLVTRTAGG